MNIIGIDPSLSCTAMVVNDRKFIYAKQSHGMTEKGRIKKWFEICDTYISYEWVNYTKSHVHSDQEILKLIEYNELTDRIINDIIKNIDNDDVTKIGIEGYSHSSDVGPLIDLVTFSTLLRNKLYNITPDIIVLPPSSLKLAACKLTYPPIEKGVRVKKYEYRNNEGMSGGSFQKPEMYKALMENTQLQSDPWVMLLKEHASDILTMNTIPKPIEDMNDAKLLYEILKSNK